ncbi:hypothetical protein HII13_004409 [Brettanomyces bruxellensis]|uniref:Telomerase reverse transcriptase n=2 Tax=Dekkera bruxellensis TaxID=5007 RepID=A0A7D9GZC3_DEKBR|nr:hypothetical protein HII13_004409 [Brettanomyces bruxellensis]VUG17883.1 DEBR0S2_18448g1_1 [Brettanomyces bruxellensis]
MLMLSLREFILRYQHRQIYQQLISDNNFGNETDRLCNDILLHSLEVHRQTPSHLLYSAEFEDHDKLIDRIVQYFASNDTVDALTIAYIHGNQIRNASNSLVCTGISIPVQLLKSPLFRMIHAILGPESFLLLILQYSAHLKSTHQKLWGPLKELSYLRKGLDYRSINFKSMMYKEEYNLDGLEPLPNGPRACLNEIFGAELSSKNHLPKRYRKLSKLIGIVIKNHSHFKCEYPYILDSVCGQVHSKGDNYLKMATKKQHIVRFLLIIIDKLFPLEHVGCNYNKRLLCDAISMFVNVRFGEFIDVKTLINGMKLTEISWVKPQASMKMTKQEFCRASQMFETYIKWLFGCFLCKLIGSFFHVTEASQSAKLYYYRHECWKSISSRFRRRYFSAHLQKVEYAHSSFKSFFDNDTFLAKMKILPKPHDFRLIAAPYKGNQEEEFAYTEYQAKLMKPVGRILRSLKAENSIFSVADLVGRVARYRQDLISRYRCVPKVYALKLDVKSAYDYLPIDLVENVVKVKLDKHYPLDNICVNQYRVVRNKYITSKRCSVVFNSSLEQKIPKANNGNIIVQNETPIVLSKSDIIDFVHKQLNETSILYHGVTYCRKNGVFQGFQLSGVFFDLVYDDVTEFFRNVIPDADKGETLVLRLVDDFLFLSTSKLAIQIIRKLTCRPIEKFNLHINHLKTKYSETELQFVGLNLDLASMSFTKGIDTYRTDALLMLSFPKLFRRMEYTFATNLNSPLFDINASSQENVEENIKNILQAFTLRFISSYKLMHKRENCLKADFDLFVKNLIDLVSTRVNLQSMDLTYPDLEKPIMGLLQSKRITFK